MATPTPIAAGMNIDNLSLVLSSGNMIQVAGNLNTYIADVNYTALPLDTVIAYTSLTTARTVTLTPCGNPGTLKFWRIKDKSNNCSVSQPINLASTSGTFDGFVSAAITTPGGSKTFYDDGTNFFMVGAFMPSVNGSSILQKADGNGGFLNAVAGTDYLSPGSLATVATTGSYTDLTNKPSIPSAQVNTDWSASSGTAQLLNKPTLATVATTGSYNDLINQPTIPNTTRTTSSLSLSLVGTGATGTQISATKNSTVYLNASTSTTTTIGGPSTSIVALKKCATNNATEGSWTTVVILENDQTITLAVVLQSIQVLKGQLVADIPTGWFVKLVNSGTGTHSEAFISGEQTIYG